MMTEYSSAEVLRDMATHFAPQDWDYSRNHTIRYIRYSDDFRGYNALGRRWVRAFASLFKPPALFARKGNLLDRFLYKLAYFKVQVRTDRHLPDGVLSCGVIAPWEEDGEYIQMVQPSVGELLADFLLAEPDNPHAVAITAELDRIRRRYKERVKAADVTGGNNA